MPFVEEFLHRIFEYYDKDADGFLNPEEFVTCYVSHARHYDNNIILIYIRMNCVILSMRLATIQSCKMKFRHRDQI